MIHADIYIYIINYNFIENNISPTTFKCFTKITTIFYSWCCRSLSGYSVAATHLIIQFYGNNEQFRRIDYNRECIIKRRPSMKWI